MSSPPLLVTELKPAAGTSLQSGVRTRTPAKAITLLPVLLAALYLPESLRFGFECATGSQLLKS